MPTKLRDRALCLVAGFRGHGKSTTIADIVFRSPDDNALVFLEEEDIYADAYKDFPLVSIWNYKGGKAKISAGEVDYETFLRLVIKYFRNGSIVIDEAGLYEDGKLSPLMVELIKKMRKLGIDVYLMYHGVSELPLKFFKYVNWVILFHSTDVFRFRYGVPKMAELIKAKEEIAAEVARGNKYACRAVNLL